MYDQPHILVTGDAWQYVPFGRARLKALRSTGLSYSSQTFKIDETVIKVRIAGTQSFIEVNGEGTIYCESGQLSWPFRPLDSPLWGEAATWHFMDIGLGEKYLGKIKLTEKPGDQKNKPALTEGMRSKAIGWPLATGDGADEKNTKTRDEYSANTLTKKRAVMGWPASIFSGKMRLFMQSLYGAKEPKPETGYFPFIYSDDIIPTLEFQGAKKVGNGGGMLLVRPNSMGIFTAPDDTYWLLDINEGAAHVIVTRIDTSSTNALVKQLKDMNADERTKAEAYIFANCKLDIPDSEHTVLAKGTFAVAPGSPMAYGWKWNTDGSKASVVHHEELGDGNPLFSKWHARTTHLTFTYTAKTDKDPAFINVTGEVIDHNEWIDGWGLTNMWIPGTPPPGLDIYSLRCGAPPWPPIFAFPFTPIYGWYVNDVWTPLQLTSDSPGGYEVNSSSSGMLYAYGGSCPPHSVTPAAGAVVDGVTSHSWTVNTSNFNRGYRAKFGDKDFSQEAEDRDFVTQIYWGTAGGPGAPENVPINWVHTSESPFPLSTTPTALADYAAYPLRIYGNGVEWTLSSVQTHLLSTKNTFFAIVVPSGDAEALYIPYMWGEVGTETSANYDLGIAQQRTVQVAHVEGEINVWDTLDNFFVLTTNGCSSYSSAPGWLNAGTLTGTTVTPVSRGETGVVCISRSTLPFEGVPGGSYAAIFEVPYYYPRYDRGMYTYASFNGRYIMSEAPPKPTTITWHNFVGWA